MPTTPGASSIIEALRFPDADLISAGKRLLRFYPNDRGVIYYAISVKHYSSRLAEVREAALEAEVQLKKHPKSFNYCGLLAGIYDRIYMITSSRTDCAAALAYYKKALALLPPGGGAQRIWIRHMIEVLEKDLAR